MRTRRYAVALALVGTLTAACGYAPTPLPSSPSSTTASPTPTPTGTTSTPPCLDALQSYAPTGPLPDPGALPSGSTMADIRNRKRLIAGVSADTYLFASRNPLTGVIEGFDIDIVNAIATAIFGDAKGHVELRVITAADRITLLQQHEVDVVVRTMTINCDRWKQIAFSTEYYRAGQQILVRKGSDIAGLAGLAAKRVCAPRGTSSLDNLVRLAPRAIPVPAANHTGCLLLFQEGRADAITGDDTVLAGLAAQDPYAVVLSGPDFTQEPYGVGIPLTYVDMVQFVNGVLEKMRSDGSWTRSYNRWLARTLGPAPTPPTPQYGRTP